MENQGLKFLVWNPYFNKANLGDELFKIAYQRLFPGYQLTFSDRFTSDFDVLFIGGGSFLDGEPPFSYSDLKDKKYFYLGVGAETDIHPKHQELIKGAQGVFVRSSLDKVKDLNNNSWLIPDLVFSLRSDTSFVTQEKLICISLNSCVIPSWNDPIWKHNSWEYFKTEMSQVLENLVQDGYTIDFLSMCGNPQVNDTWAAHEVIAKMNKKASFRIIEKRPASFYHFLKKYSVFITQRYHGIILAQLLEIPYLAICHHDKLLNHEPQRGSHLSYYNFSKNCCLEQFRSLSSFKNDFTIDNFQFMQKYIDEICTS